MEYKEKRDKSVKLTKQAITKMKDVLSLTEQIVEIMSNLTLEEEKDLELDEEARAVRTELNTLLAKIQ